MWFRLAAATIRAVNGFAARVSFGLSPRRACALLAVAALAASLVALSGAGAGQSKSSSCPSTMTANHPAGPSAPLVPDGAVSIAICRYRGFGDPATSYFGMLAGTDTVTDSTLVRSLTEEFNGLTMMTPPSQLPPYIGPPSCPLRNDGYFAVRFTYANGAQAVLTSGSAWCITVTNGSYTSYLTFSPDGYALLATIDEFTGCRASDVGACDHDAPPVQTLPAFSLSASKRPLSYRGEPQTLRIRVRTGFGQQAVAVAVTEGSWPDPGVIGSPLKVTGPAISGAGRIARNFVSSGVGFPAGPQCDRGTVIDGVEGVVLTLPSHSVTTLTYRITLAAPPWPGLAPTVAAVAYLPDSNDAPLRSLGPVRLFTGGPTGVRIALTAPGASLPAHPDAPLTVHDRQRVVIHGTTMPPLLHGVVHIGIERYRRDANHSADLPIGTAITDARGQFSLNWRDPTPGTYRITASIPHPGHGLLPDHGCDLALTVG